MPNPRRARRAPRAAARRGGDQRRRAGRHDAQHAGRGGNPLLSGGRDPRQEGKAGDASWSRAVRAKHALARATKALASDTPAAERPDATMALRNLWLLKDALSPADRAAADKLARRPSKPAVIGDANMVRSRRCLPAPASRRSSYRSCCSRATYTQQERPRPWPCRSSSGSGWLSPGRFLERDWRPSPSRARGWSASSRPSAFHSGHGGVLRLTAYRCSPIAGLMPRRSPRVSGKAQRRLARIARRGAGCRDPRTKAGAHRPLGDLVQELSDDGQDDARGFSGDERAGWIRQDQVPGGEPRRGACEAGHATTWVRSAFPPT